MSTNYHVAARVDDPRGDLDRAVAGVNRLQVTGRTRRVTASKAALAGAGRPEPAGITSDATLDEIRAAASWWADVFAGATADVDDLLAAAGRSILVDSPGARVVEA